MRTASALGLTEADDWWLLDDELLIVMPWSPTGHDLPIIVTTDQAAVATARQLWQIAWGPGSNTTP